MGPQRPGMPPLGPPPGVAVAVAELAFGMSALLAAQLNLSISCSRRWVASNACQCASLASLRAWPCGSFFLTQVWQQDLAWWLGHKMLAVVPLRSSSGLVVPHLHASTLPRKHRFPNQGPPSALAHMVGAQ